MRRIEGAFAFVALSEDCMIGARDPLGVRPLVIGKLPHDGYIFASETCALDIIGADYIRDVEPGEVVTVTKSGMSSVKPFPASHPRPCIFEHVYFSRPDSLTNGTSIYKVRKNIGKELAKECKLNADLVVPVPDSGVPSAIGYAQEAGIPFELGIIRNHYVGRTFIELLSLSMTVSYAVPHRLKSLIWSVKLAQKKSICTSPARQPLTLAFTVLIHPIRTNCWPAA